MGELGWKSGLLERGGSEFARQGGGVCGGDSKSSFWRRWCILLRRLQWEGHGIETILVFHHMYHILHGGHYSSLTHWSWSQLCQQQKPKEKVKRQTWLMPGRNGLAIDPNKVAEFEDIVEQHLGYCLWPFQVEAVKGQLAGNHVLIALQDEQVI